MGKKNANVNQGKRGDKEIQAVDRPEIINLHKLCHGVQFKNKAPQAVKRIRERIAKTYFTKDVRIENELNREIWANGVRNLPRRVNVLVQRKKNEDEEAKEPFYCLVKLNH